MDKIRLEIVGLSYSQTQSGAYALVLSEVGGKRRLPIIIGGFEAQAIAIELEKMTPTRPLTHDLFKSFAVSFGITVKEVVIYNLQEGIFYAKLVCEKDGQLTDIDARTWDAIALGVRFKSPIFPESGSGKLFRAFGMRAIDSPHKITSRGTIFRKKFWVPKFK